MKILFGVFDWGLGHATRDIPLIEECLKRKHKVHILSTDRALAILKKHFGNRCKYFDVPSLYGIYYNNGSRFFKFNFTISGIKLIKSLNEARKHSEKIINLGKYDRVISDCRYDVYDKKSNSYLINHQVRFKAPFIAERIIEAWLTARMKKYKYILVPDYVYPNLSGKLSHNLKFIDKNKLKYIGIISHVRKTQIKKDIDYFISFSGPEPARTLLEKKVLLQVKELKGKIVIAGGNPNGKTNVNLKNVEFYNFVKPKQQIKFMNRAKFFVVRAGYTTLMDLVELSMGGLIIPAPGQTEQVYLGNYLEKNKIFHSVKQGNLNLKKDIIKAMKFEGFKAPWKTKKSVENFIRLVDL